MDIFVCSRHCKGFISDRAIMESFSWAFEHMIGNKRFYITEVLFIDKTVFVNFFTIEFSWSIDKEKSHDMSYEDIIFIHVWADIVDKVFEESHITDNEQIGTTISIDDRFKCQISRWFHCSQFNQFILITDYILEVDAESAMLKYRYMSCINTLLNIFFLLNISKRFSVVIATGTSIIDVFDKTVHI